MTSALFDVIQKGGPLMWFILLCSVTALTVMIERLIYFHRNTTSLDVFLAGITNLLRTGMFKEALERCDDTYGPSIRVVQAAILKRHLPKNELKEITQEVAQLQVPKLEAHLSVLTTIAVIAPLIGLLGTVTGMIGAFMTIDQAMGSVPVSQLAASIWEALITTAGGLVVAIPCYVAYNYLLSRVHHIVTDMERAGIEIIQILSESTSATPTASPTYSSKQ